MIHLSPREKESQQHSLATGFSPLTKPAPLNIVGPIKETFRGPLSPPARQLTRIEGDFFGGTELR